MGHGDSTSGDTVFKRTQSVRPRHGAAVLLAIATMLVGAGCGSSSTKTDSKATGSTPSVPADTTAAASASTTSASDEQAVLQAQMNLATVADQMDICFQDVKNATTYVGCDAAANVKSAVASTKATLTNVTTKGYQVAVDGAGDHWTLTQDGANVTHGCSKSTSLLCQSWKQTSTTG